MNIFIEPLSGATDTLACLAWFLLAFIGAFTAIAIRAKFSYKNNLYTPYPWSLLSLIRDNLTLLVLSYFITFILFRLTNEVLKTEPNIGFAVFVGAVSNELALFLIKYGFTARK